jgi:hypothetical protein
VCVHVTWGDQPQGEPVEVRLVDALARGVGTVPELAEALGVPAPEVAAAVTWAVDEGLATRMPLTQGEHLALTERGLTLAAIQQRLASAVGPDGEIDLATLGREVGATWQPAQEGRAAERARSEASSARRGDLATATAGLEVPGTPGAGSLQSMVRTFLLVAVGLLALGTVMITLLVLLVRS